MLRQNLRTVLVAIVCSVAAGANPAWAGDMETCGNEGTRFDDAIVVCSRLINSTAIQGRRLAEAYTYRGRAFSGTGQYDLALADLAKAIAIDPRFGAPYSERGRIYHLQKDDARALAEYDRANAVDPKYPDAYANRALIYAARQEYDGAISEYTKAIELDQKSETWKVTFWYLGRGNLYASKGKYERALADVDRVIELRPSWDAGHRLRARVLEKMGK